MCLFSSAIPSTRFWLNSKGAKWAICIAIPWSLYVILIYEFGLIGIAKFNLGNSNSRYTYNIQILMHTEGEIMKSISLIIFKDISVLCLCLKPFESWTWLFIHETNIFYAQVERSLWSFYGSCLSCVVNIYMIALLKDR